MYTRPARGNSPRLRDNQCSLVDGSFDYRRYRVKPIRSWSARGPCCTLNAAICLHRYGHDLPQKGYRPGHSRMAGFNESAGKTEEKTVPP